LDDAHFDAVIVGSGFGGSVTAYWLAEAVLRVCLLERGKPYPPDWFLRAPHRMQRNFWDPSESLLGKVQIEVNIISQTAVYSITQTIVRGAVEFLSPWSSVLRLRNSLWWPRSIHSKFIQDLSMCVLLRRYADPRQGGEAVCLHRSELNAPLL
jgi:choline dehydrogenase-like flavoprotein